jgi:hypothetical protein
MYQFEAMGCFNLPIPLFHDIPPELMTINSLSPYP